MKSLLVIGMGRFGSHLARKLMDLGNDVMIIDQDEKIINGMAASFTDAFVGDCTNPEVISSLSVKHFDVCFVTIGDNFQSSLEITSLLKEAGAKYIVSKATVDMQAKFLRQIGANEVVYPEHDMAVRLAIKHSARNVFDYIELGEDYAIYEIPILTSWQGFSILDLNIRKMYSINIVAIKKSAGVIASPNPDYVFESGDHIIVIAKSEYIDKITRQMDENTTSYASKKNKKKKCQKN